MWSNLNPCMGHRAAESPNAEGEAMGFKIRIRSCFAILLLTASQLECRYRIKIHVRCAPSGFICALLERGQFAFKF